MPRDEYERLLRRLAILKRAAPGNGRAHEAVREQMDRLWNYLTEAERAEVNRIEAGLRE